MKIIAYAKYECEKVFIGTFESLDEIHDEVALKLETLGLIHWTRPKTLNVPIYITQGLNEFRLIWGANRK